MLRPIPTTVFGYQTFLRNGKSVVFDGVDEYVDCGDFANFERTDPFSISGWVKFTDLTAGTVIAKRGSAGTARGWHVFQNAGELYLILTNDNGIGNKLQVKGGALLVDTWYGFVLTYDGSSTAAGVMLYVDNATPALTADFDALTGTIVTGTAVTIGARAGVSNFHAGHIDELAIWDKELSASEARKIWNEGAPSNLRAHPAFDNLVSWWRMGDGDTFPTLTDNKGSNDGTMTNMESGDIVEDVS